MIQRYSFATLVRYAFPVVRHNHLFGVDLKSRVFAMDDVPPEYKISFPCNDPPVSSLEALGLGASTRRKYEAAGDLLGIVVKGDTVVHRSLVQMRGSIRIAGDRKAYSLRPGQAYIHHCETALDERGKGLYPAMLKTVLNALQPLGIGLVYVSCEQKNIASQRGILKAGFQIERSALSISVLWGRVHHSFWYRGCAVALKG